MNIIITGAGKGIGFETAMRFCSSKDHQVIAISRDIRSLLECCSGDNKNGNYANLHPIAIDITKKGFEPKLISQILKITGNIDILINNAGMLINKHIDQLTEDDFDSMFSINTKAPFLLTKALLPYFNNPSHVVNIGSMGGFQGSSKFAGLSLYSASKGALAIMTECFAEELKHLGIHANCLALGSVQTEMFTTAFPSYKAQLTATEMAKFIVEFSITGHHIMNGKVIPVSLSTP